MGSHLSRGGQRLVVAVRGHRAHLDVCSLDVKSFWYHWRHPLCRRLQHFLHSWRGDRGEKDLSPKPNRGGQTRSHISWNTRLDLWRYWSTHTVCRMYVSCALFFAEDILRRDHAIWVSPDATKIVYATFNDSQVQNVQWKIYGDGRDASVNPYPKEAYMRYPKVSNAIH